MTMKKREKEILEKVSFEARYVALYRENKGKEPKKEIGLEIQKEIIEKLERKVRYNKSERFFKYSEKESGTRFQLNLAIRNSFIEPILDINNDDKNFSLGGPFGGLAKDLNPKLEAYFKISYADEKDLEKNIGAIFDLYDDIKLEVQKHLENE